MPRMVRRSSGFRPTLKYCTCAEAPVAAVALGKNKYGTIKDENDYFASRNLGLNQNLFSSLSLSQLLIIVDATRRG